MGNQNKQLMSVEVIKTSRLANHLASLFLSEIKFPRQFERQAPEVNGPTL